jgi:hypothetical protein
MPDLRFAIGDVRSMSYSAVPTIVAPLRICNTVQDEPIQSIALNCQIQLQPLGRSYTAAEEASLLDLFGERSRWGQTMKPLHWMNQVLKVQPFHGEITVDLLLPCSFDLEIAVAKYLYGLEAGSVAGAVMLSGTIFYSGEAGVVQISQIPWDREALFQIPIAVWRNAMDAHYANHAFLRLPRATFDRLYRYKVSHGIPMWSDVMEQLLDRTQHVPTCELAVVEGESQ